MRIRPEAVFLMMIAALVAVTGYAQAPAASSEAPKSQAPSIMARPQTTGVALSPAVIVGHGKFGQTMMQTLTLTNGTDQEFAFEMVADDVVVRDGKRDFVPAGNIANGIAQSAVFSQNSGVVKPHGFVSVDVRLTVPQATPVRAVVAIFRGTKVHPTGQGTVGMTASLGCLITFNLSDEVRLEAEPLHAVADPDASSVTVEQWLANRGAEPAITSGVAAILNADGKLVGKVPFEQQRLLPGERLKFTALYGSALRPGSYRVLSSFEFEGHQLTNSGTLRVE